MVTSWKQDPSMIKQNPNPLSFKIIGAEMIRFCHNTIRVTIHRVSYYYTVNTHARMNRKIMHNIELPTLFNQIVNCKFFKSTA